MGLLLCWTKGEDSHESREGWPHSSPAHSQSHPIRMGRVGIALIPSSERGKGPVAILPSFLTCPPSSSICLPSQWQGGDGSEEVTLRLAGLLFHNRKHKWSKITEYTHHFCDFPLKSSVGGEKRWEECKWGPGREREVLTVNSAVLMVNTPFPSDIRMWPGGNEFWILNIRIRFIFLSQLLTFIPRTSHSANVCGKFPDWISQGETSCDILGKWLTMVFPNKFIEKRSGRMIPSTHFQEPLKKHAMI